MGRPLGHYGGGEEPGTVRLFRRGVAKFDGHLVHESFSVNEPIGTLHAPLLHYCYPTLATNWQKIHRHAPLEAQERLLHASPRCGRWIRGFGKLGWMLIVRRGVIDGPYAWVWIPGQAYQEWLATGRTASLRRKGAQHATG